MQNTFSQGKEDLFVLNYFGDYKGTLLEVGSNNGTDLSNSLLLIQQGYSAHLVEPGVICADLFLLHKDNPKVHIYNFGIGDKEEIVKFWDSDAHVPNGKDRGLVSTVNFEETLRWPDVKFTERKVQLVPFNEFYKSIDSPVLDFISIDAEGNDLLILEQIDLEKVGCRCLCIEYNSDPKLAEKFVNYCEGYKLALVNAENLIFCK